MSLTLICKSFTLYINKTKQCIAWLFVELPSDNSTGIIFLQINYNIGARLSQAGFAKGGILMYIFRASKKTKDGSVIYARDYGKRAFKIWIDKKKK